MKKLFFSALPVAALAIILFRPLADPLAIGSPIPNPEVKLKDVSGKEVSFKEAAGKNGLLVMFSCNTCPVVAKYQSRTLELAKLAISNEVGVVVVNSNEATREDGESFDDMKEYAKGQGYNFHYVLDNNSNMADAFGASRTPEIYLFGKDGKLAYSGAIDDNSNGGSGVSKKYAADAIQSVAAGKEVGTKQTRSVGCTIKRLN